MSQALSQPNAYYRISVSPIAGALGAEIDGVDTSSHPKGQSGNWEM
jgi:hypothetical protein